MNILEDLEILILQNEDDFDRGMGKYILRNFIKEKEAEQLKLNGVGSNEVDKKFKPCGDGINTCNCKNDSETLTN